MIDILHIHHFETSSCKRKEMMVFRK